MLIGLSGKKQSGKNTVCNIIKAIDCYKTFKIESISLIDFCKSVINGTAGYHSKWNEYSFAYKVKEVASVLTGFPITLWESNEVKLKYNQTFKCTNRELLQKIGDGLRKEIDPNIWINILFNNVNNYNFNIITDVRYLNEAQEIKSRNGILIRINKAIHTLDAHKSEIDLDAYNEWDYIIDNNGTLEYLIEQVIEIYNKIENLWK